MKNFITELRRRQVFRATGLYIGVAWIVLEGADILLPAFEAPDWVFRTLVIVAFAGAPVTAVLAWIYEITERGIKREAEVEAEHLPRMHGRQMDFIVIGVLVVALSFSVYLNVQEEPVAPEQMEPVSILIADFDNQTGDPVFDGSLEQALTIGLESAPFITAYRRDTAASLAAKLQAGAEGLDVEASRLVSVREGIKYVLAGSIRPDGEGYEFSVSALDPTEGTPAAEAGTSASSKAEVLAAVGTLAGQIREALGDQTLDSGQVALSETFTAASLEAASDYTKAQVLAYKLRFEEALEYYQRAIDADPNFGRAFSGYALTLSNMGRTDEAEVMWKKALATLDTMTEREKYRTLGLYYSVVSQNFDKAIENYERLVELYPADGAGHNNLAVSYFLTLDFDRAREEGLRVLEIYPNSVLYRGNYALYAMYAGDFETAVAEALKVLEQDPGYYKAYLPLAIAALAAGDTEGAIGHYRKMSETNPSGESLATLGLADVAIYSGKPDGAITLLAAGIGRDRDAGRRYDLGHKSVTLAAFHANHGSFAPAEEALRDALDHSRAEAIVFPAARLLIQLGREADARHIAEELGRELQPQDRAYGKLIEGMLAMAGGSPVEAIELIRASIELTDLWLARFHLGIVYLEAGYAAEALSEFELCETRIGEAASLFLDDFPTWRYTAPLNYWKARAQEAIGITPAAISSYQAFLALRPETNEDPLAVDARQRLETLAGNSP